MRQCRQRLIQFYDHFIRKERIFLRHTEHWAHWMWNMLLYYRFHSFMLDLNEKNSRKFASFHEWAIACKLINRSKCTSIKKNSVHFQYNNSENARNFSANTQKSNGFCEMIPVSLRTSKKDEEARKNMSKIFVMASFKEEWRMNVMFSFPSEMDYTRMPT